MTGKDTPGPAPSTAAMAMSRWPGVSAVLQTTRKRSASPASETQALRPVSRHAPSSPATARVVIAVASDPACGSVSEKAPSASPAARRVPHSSPSSGWPAIAAATALCIESENASDALAADLEVSRDDGRVQDVKPFAEPELLQPLERWFFGHTPQ